MKQELLERLDELRDALTGDMIADMNIRNEMHQIEMELNETRPQDSYFECENCGS
jgi:hypothetical protein